jgi:hypothetical protein
LQKRKEQIKVKKIAFIFTILLLLGITIPAQAEENANTSKGDFIALAGTKSLVQGDYKLTNNLTLNGEYGAVSDYLEKNKYDGDKDNFLRTDLHYQITDWLGVKMGGRYDSETSETIPYGGFDFVTPFGSNNLKFSGFYNYNYEGKNWADYEFAWRIEMYSHQYIYVGVRGDHGDGFIPYSYNTENDPQFFLRGDITGEWKKFGMNFRPLLYATGEMFTDTNFKYTLTDRTNIVLNFNDYYDHDMKYRLGIEHKF